VKIDVDQNPEITQRFRIQAMPTLMLFKDGKVAAQQVGALVQKKKLEDWIKSSI
jgi:thioredoxin 1